MKYLLPLLLVLPFASCASFGKLQQAEDFISSYEEEKIEDADAALEAGDITLDEWRAIQDEIQRWAEAERRKAIEEGASDIEGEASIWWELFLAILLGTGGAGGAVAVASRRRKTTQS
jgi:hypothetical protein